MTHVAAPCVHGAGVASGGGFLLSAPRGVAAVAATEHVLGPTGALWAHAAGCVRATDGAMVARAGTTTPLAPRRVVGCGRGAAAALRTGERLLIRPSTKCSEGHHQPRRWRVVIGPPAWQR